MADKTRDNDEPSTAQHFEEEAQQARQRAELIRQALLESDRKAG